LFAWTVCKHTKSNAIVYARDKQTVGVGAGQMSRVDSVKIGAMRAQLPIEGSVMASDAFFPFRDGVDEAAKHGITAVIQPGGSMRDEEVIAAADEHNLAMVFTGIRHYVHRSEEHTSELQSRENLVCRLLLEKKKKKNKQ